MAKKERTITGEKYNKTQLNIGNSQQRLIIHRDHIVHTTRFGHVFKYLKKGKEGKVILDVGCGDKQLAMAIYTNKYGSTIEHYHAVDLRDKDPIENFTPTFKVTMHQQDVTDELPNVNPEIVVCFEVIEHMSKEKGLILLDRLEAVVRPGVTLLLSTPCYDEVNMAANHIYEWKFNELKEELAKRFSIGPVYGTFMHTRNMEDVLSEWIKPETIQKLREYFDTNFLSPMFAPLVPEHSRNAMWTLTSLFKG